MTREPRWLESELPEELRDAMQQAEAYDASAPQLARLRSRLGDAIGPGFSHAGQAFVRHGTGAGARSLRLFALAKPLALLSLVGLGLSALWWSQSAPARHARTQATTASDSSALAAIASETHIEVVSDAAGVAVSAGEPTASPPSAAAPLAPVESRPSKPRAREPGLAEELQQLALIRREVERSPQRALAAAHVHEQRFPQGALGPERQLLRIEALLRLGDYDRARQLAERVLAGPVTNPYQMQVAALLSRYTKRADAAQHQPKSWSR